MKARELESPAAACFRVLRPGDRLVVQRSHISALQPGDLVTFLGPDRRICTHRVTGFKDGKVLTRGDAAPAVDLPLAPHEILGIVVEVRRGGRSFTPSRVPPLWQRAIAGLCRRSVLFHRFALCLWALWSKPG